MIEIVTGLPGSGKTLSMTRRILAARLAGRRVIANFHSTKNIWEFGLWEQFKTAENALCVIDEAQMWLNSREFKNNSVADLAVFQQSRKNGLDLVVVCQHENRVDIAVRELSAYIHRCKNLFGKYTLVKTYSADEPEKCMGREIFRHNKQLYDHYFTTEVIGERDGKGYQLGAASLGGRSELVDGRLTPTHIRIESEFGVRNVPVAEFDVAWENLARLYNRSRGHFFTWRPYAFIEGHKIWTDEEQETETWTAIDQILTFEWVRGVERFERKIGVLK